MRKTSPKVALRPLFNQSAPDAPITVIESDSVLIVDDETVSGRVEIKFECLPRPEFAFEFRTSEPFPFKFVFIEPEAAELKFTALGREHSIKPRLIGRSVRGENTTLTGDFVMAGSGGFIHGPSPPQTLVFHLFSFPEILGEPIRENGRSSGGWLGSVEFGDHEFGIRIDQLQDKEKCVASARARGQLRLSHVGHVIKHNGERFEDSEVERVLDKLHTFLTFCRGAMAGPQLVGGIDDSGTCLLDLIPRTYVRRSHPNNWLHSQACEGFQVFDSLSKLVDDPASSEMLWHVIYWYAHANVPGQAVEGSIILAQAALETLACWLLVEVDKSLSPGGFEKLSAADRLRLLVSHYAHLVDVPSHFESLVKFAKEFNHQDGAASITDARNCLIHPTAKNRERARRLTARGKYEVLQLALCYIELCILRLLNYDGQFFNRCPANASTFERLDFVPWHRPSSDE